MDVLAPAEADAVSDLLAELTVRSSIFCISELRAPWAFSVAASDVAKFHVVLDGSACLTVDGREPVTLGTGELVVLLGGDAHVLGDRAGTRPVPLEDLPVDGDARLRHGGSGPVTRLLCGGFTVTHPGIPGLPRVLKVDASATAWLEPVLTTLSLDDRPGRLAISAKVADLFVAESLRSWFAAAEESVAGAARDRTVAKAVDALRTRFGERWTLDRLAAHVGLSRSALNARFRELVGEPPMRYLARVRLSHAAGELASGRLSLYEIARLTGYDSDAALSKAFKREFGQPPGAYRASARRPPAVTGRSPTPVRR